MAVKKGSAMQPETSILDYVAKLDDPRMAKNQKHPLINLIAIARLGGMWGADTGVDIERYGNAKQAWLGPCLDLSNGIPAHDAFGRVFRWLDSEQFQAQLMAWRQHRCELTVGQEVSLEGKKLRRSHDKRPEGEGSWRGSAWAGAKRIGLGQTTGAEKSNAITALPRLLSALDLSGCVVTLDALGRQTARAQPLVKCKAEYILPVQEHQGTL